MRLNDLMARKILSAIESANCVWPLLRTAVIDWHVLRRKSDAKRMRHRSARIGLHVTSNTLPLWAGQPLRTSNNSNCNYAITPSPPMQ